MLTPLPGTSAIASACHGRLIPFQCLESILEFLNDRFKEGREYRTLNVYCSAFSAVLPKVDSSNVGSHPLVCQFLEGHFQLGQPVLKYPSTWDVSVVLSHIKSIGPHFSLSLRLSSTKLTTLLPLTAPDRSLDLAKRDSRFQTFCPERVSFKLPGLFKTSHPGQDPKLSFHASFSDDQDLCPVACLREYEARTKDFRPIDLS